jgi:hypothetical protein
MKRKRLAFKVALSASAIAFSLWAPASRPEEPQEQQIFVQPSLPIPGTHKPQGTEAIELGCQPATVKRELPAAIKQVSIGIKDCVCFNSAEEATKWMNLLAQSWLDDPVMKSISPFAGETHDLSLGRSKRINYHCYSFDQIWKYHAEVTGSVQGR